MKAVRVGFLGLGTVGCGALRTLREGRERIAARVGAEVVAVRAAVRDVERARDVSTAGVELSTNPLAVATADDLDIIVEVIGGVGIAREAVFAAIDCGKPVVTANKELIAKHARELFDLARARGVDLAFEGSVAGGIPILRALRKSLAGNRIGEIVGIINGTTNYILSAMTQTGRPYDELLAEAQAAGYAEADPSDDVEGHDAAYKLAILAILAFDTMVDIETVHREGITAIAPADIAVAGRLGYVIKLLGIARDRGDTLDLRVHPTLVPITHPLASVNDVFNAIFVEGSSVGQMMFYGRGAGSGPTGSAVVGDILEIARSLRSGCAVGLPALDSAREAIPIGDVVSRYYVRMKVKDQAGVLAALAGILGDENVSVAQMIQTEAEEGWAEIVWITHASREASIRRSLERMAKLDVIYEICNVLRCLDGEDG